MSTFNIWLHSPIKHTDNYTIKDVLNDCITSLFYWISNRHELECEYDIQTFKHMFYLFIYKTYHIQESRPFIPYDEGLYEYFSLKMSDDIVNLFMEYKELTRSQNVLLFHTTTDNSLDLEQFLFDHLLIEDPYNNYNESDSDEENNISSSIDETNL